MVAAGRQLLGGGRPSLAAAAAPAPCRCFGGPALALPRRPAFAVALPLSSQAQSRDDGLYGRAVRTLATAVAGARGGRSSSATSSSSSNDRPDPRADGGSSDDASFREWQDARSGGGDAGGDRRGRGADGGRRREWGARQPEQQQQQERRQGAAGGERWAEPDSRSGSGRYGSQEREQGRPQQQRGPRDEGGPPGERQRWGERQAGERQGAERGGQRREGGSRGATDGRARAPAAAAVPPPPRPTAHAAAAALGTARPHAAAALAAALASAGVAAAPSPSPSSSSTPRPAAQPQPPSPARAPSAPGGAASSAPAGAAPMAVSSVPEGGSGSYPTFVPRNPGILDGAWNAADEGMVRAAQRDAAAVAGLVPATGAVAAPAAPAAVAGGKSRAEYAGAVVLGSELSSLVDLARAYGYPRFRAKQLQEGVMQGAKRIEDIQTIPKEWRAQLLADGVRTGRSRVHHSVGDEDGTRKFLLQLHDGRIIEAVGIPTEDRLTVCVSSQVGCPMRCTFCATGKGGFARNLSSAEILDQVLHVQEAYGRRVSNVVFMGMGEPMLNLPSVVLAYRGLNQQIGIGGAFITISTVGVPNTIARLAASGIKATLAVSLHAPTAALRESIIPSAKAYPLAALMEDCVAYYKTTGRRVTFEYTLLAGVNDDVSHAVELAALLQRYSLSSHVNVIPWNPVDESAFQRPSRNRVWAFKRAIEAAGLPCTIRETRGLEAAAACGQLRNSFQKQPLPDFQVPL